MKLYATVTSERASKGQGGKWLDIEVQGEHKQPIARMIIKSGGFEPSLEIIYSKNEFETPIITRVLERVKYEPKGKKQKDEHECYPSSSVANHCPCGKRLK
jgi:hypothetical protein